MSVINEYSKTDKRYVVEYLTNADTYIVYRSFKTKYFASRYAKYWGTMASAARVVDTQPGKKSGFLGLFKLREKK